MKIEHDEKFTLRGLSEKEAKSLSVFGLIRSKGLISRTDLSKDTGINIVSISNYVKDFIIKGLLYESGFETSTGGRKPELVEISSKDASVMGLHITSTEAAIVICGLGGNIIEKKRVPIAEASGACDAMARAVNAGSAKIKAVGLANSEAANNSIAASLGSSLKVPVFSGSALHAAAFAEKFYNDKTQPADLLYVNSGLGACVAAKDFELLSHGDDPKEDTKYLRPWGWRLSAQKMAKDEVEKGVGTSIVRIAGADVKNITEALVIEASKNGDDVASGIIESIGVNLGLRISYLVNIFAPKAVVIAGGIERAEGIILPVIKKMVRMLGKKEISKNLIIKSSVLGQDGAALGAAALAVRELFIRA